MSGTGDPTIHDLRTRIQRLEGEILHWLPPIVSVLAFIPRPGGTLSRRYNFALSADRAASTPVDPS